MNVLTRHAHTVYAHGAKIMVSTNSQIDCTVQARVMHTLLRLVLVMHSPFQTRPRHAMHNTFSL
jgi:hypothetical protein